MPDIIFITDLFKKAGFGHFARSFSLAKEFKKMNYKISFISPNIPLSIKKILKKEKIFILKSRQLNGIQKFNKIIIIDSYSIKKKIKNFIDRSFFSVFFEDYNKKKNHSNIIIRNNLGTIQKKNSEPNQLVGNKYCIIRKEILKNKISNFIKKKPKFIYITFGGFNKKKEIENFFNNLKKTKYFFNNPIKFYINIKIFRKEVKKIFKNFQNIQIKFVDLKIGNNFKFNKIDMAINAGGVTSAEMVYLKIPQIVMLLSADQKNNSNFIKENQLGSVFCKAIVKKNIKTNSDVDNFIKYYTVFKKNLLKKNWLDGLGTNRIASKILKVYNNEK